MTPSFGEHAYLEGIATDQLAALVFELASQLHVERQRRIALEMTLQRAGLLQSDTLDSLAGDDEIVGESRSQLDGALCRLLRIMTENGERQSPLRNQYSV